MGGEQRRKRTVTVTVMTKTVCGKRDGKKTEGGKKDGELTGTRGSKLKEITDTARQYVSLF